MPESTAEMAAAVSRATTGPDTPNSISVRRPASAAVACPLGVLALLGLYAGLIIYVLSWHPMPKPDGPDSARRLWFLGWTGLLCVACMALVALSQFFSRVDATAGPGHIQLGGANDRG